MRLVLVRKWNGELCVCGDYFSAVTAASQAAYPLPRVEEALNQLQCDKIFSTRYFAEVYQQLPVSSETAAVFTVNTAKKMYKFKRLLFSVFASPPMFQGLMDTTLSGFPGTCTYRDDIIVSGRTKKDRACRLEMVFHRLKISDV